MILERISNRKLLISLSNEEIKKFNLTFKRSNWNNSYNIIKNLLVFAKAETGFNAENCELKIETLNQSDGCLMLITLLSQNLKQSRKLYKIKSRPQVFVFSFDTTENLLCAVERLYKLHTKIDNAQLIQINEKYYMILSLKQSISYKILPLISEYGELNTKGLVECARCTERGTEILPNNAINILGEKLLKTNS